MAGPISGLGGLNLPGTVTVALLSEGATALTTVRGTPDAPFILVNNGRLPLEDPNVQPGDLVRVTRLTDEGTPRFSVSRQAEPATPGAAQALPQLLARLSGLSGRAIPESVFPPGFPANAEAVRQLVALFQGGSALGPQLDKLVLLLRNARADHPAMQVLSTLAEQFAAVQGAPPEQMAALLKSLAQRRAPESALLGATQDDIAALLRGDLGSAVEQLLSDPAVRAAMERSGRLDEFLGAARGILERLDGARAQQLHGAQQGYVFLELPLPPEAGFHHAAVHFFHEGNAHAAGRDALPSVAVLDVDLSNLGPLWISVRAFQGTCACEILAASPEVAAALEGAAPGMADGLRAAGYSQVQVRAATWDADRLGKTGELLARLRPLDLSV